MSKYRDPILKLITDERPNYISGQTIAEKLNISRMTVKKVIDQLKAEGISIDSVHNKGHRLNTFPNTWHTSIVQSVLTHQPLFDIIHCYDSVASTQLEAKHLLVDHDEPMLIISDTQTEGRGRFKRPWQSSKGKGLWMSLVLRPQISYAMLTTFNLFMSLAIRDAIQAYVDEDVKIKWPNDIYIGEKKICGFLTEMVANADGIEAVICGIGININQTASDWDDEIRQIATSIKIESGQSIERYTFLETLISHIAKRYHQFLTSSFKSIKEEYVAASNIWHRQLRFTEGKRQFYGKVIEIDDEGFLHVVDTTGTIHRLMSADIEL
ncbi:MULTISPECIES: biotin--[acetyl-CoA-carboxylase] ligase [Staphylococcus]|uniref:biotin--[acetyl-CoA-carboxylase] ligase n=1 Tax=Staphylococcus TaxID=1279 RepID=UPI000D1A55D8|nr:MULTISPECIES: biotin--[acetyl-CoA-carboxylase] ligase [Staphylococcus]MCO4326756.1 biotin--[acetyl-CoA-carboxylase] ligase [Staphylococcus agnetis]MCO4369791.1 biotin--[acetyl-CoA-carboxylase] ligase [Staphylococcus agnetis]NHM74746.1 biotin--[acetyl-CoA-carboxylase] ligase [Staphylococcus sp. 11007852]NJH84736.1 biotin--[acetyl-CoA-carboxylase] ligase [Staphylococcus agnetis]NJH87054.1 biotin--[acetyl-CoA-carboxylase] ligase [Staphylococcus agnetis]